MTQEQTTTWIVRVATWATAAIASRWVSLDHSYQLLVITAMIEWAVSGALLIKQKGLREWCPYAAAWGLVAKGVIVAIVYCAHEMSDSFSEHMQKPLDIAPGVALAFTIQQFITIIKKSKGLDVEPPPLVDSLMKLAERMLQQRVGGDVVVEEKSIATSSTGEVTHGEKVTTIRAANPKVDAPLVVPATDVVKPGKE